ncbi:hypothetical protein AHAS_Ahas11G0293600 [Arachis hypogaea]
MVSGNDPVKSFFNSIQVVKESLSPLEVGIQKVAKDLERCFLLGHKNKGTKALPTPFKAGRRGGDGVEVSEEVEDEEEAEPAVEIGIEEVKGGGRVVMVMTIVMVVVREVSGGRIWD